jgi:hypothetical protein
MRWNLMEVICRYGRRRTRESLVIALQKPIIKVCIP